MGYIITGVVLAVIGIILWIVKGKKAGKSNQLALFETSKVAEVIENYDSINASMGAGSFSHNVEIKGKAHSDTPLTGEFSNEPMVYFKSTLTHEYEKLQIKETSEGKKEERWVKHADVVADNERYADGFGVKDDSGFVAVNGRKSKFYIEKTHSSFEKGEATESSKGISLRIKGMTVNLGGAKPNAPRTIGYRYLESGIRQNANLLVIGEANDRDGSLIISQPSDKKELFIVSTRSKDEILGNIGGMIKGYTIGAFVFWCAAVAFTVVGIIKVI